MANLNHITLAGYLTRDPELRVTANGTSVATLGLAINHRYRQGDEWRESATAYLSKGSPVLVEGRLRWRSWEGQDGQKRSKHDVLASTVQFLPRSNGAMTVEHEPGEDCDEVPF